MGNVRDLSFEDVIELSRTENLDKTCVLQNIVIAHVEPSDNELFPEYHFTFRIDGRVYLQGVYRILGSRISVGFDNGVTNIGLTNNDFLFISEIVEDLIIHYESSVVALAMEEIEMFKC